MDPASVDGAPQTVGDLVLERRLADGLERAAARGLE